MFSVTKYDSENAAAWDAFVKKSPNAVFLHFRGYMGYHAHRFRDNSLMVYKNGNLCALLPANLADDGSLHSHSGLTYGGFLFLYQLKYTELLAIWKHVLEHIAENGIKAFYFKPIPEIYIPPSFYQQEECALAHFGFFEKKSESNFVIDLSEPNEIQQRRKRGAAKAARLGLVFSENPDFLFDFWENSLTPNLSQRHKVSPVHSFAEISLLRSRFPHNIKAFFAVAESKVLAGTVLYLHRKTAHAQYIAASPEGRQSGATDFLFLRLLEKLRSDGFRYLSLGVCADRATGGINLPLAEWKEGWGARAWPQKEWASRKK